MPKGSEKKVLLCSVVQEEGECSRSEPPPVPHTYRSKPTAISKKLNGAAGGHLFAQQPWRALL